jgi:hypothetical protein
MSGKSIFAAIATLLIAVSVHDMASAQGAAGYQVNQPTGHPKAKVPSYAFNRHGYHAEAFTRRQLSAVYDEAAAAQIRAMRQRTLNEHRFITQELNLEGYPRGAGD